MTRKPCQHASCGHAGRRNCTGFTMTEMMITVGIAALLIVVALPSFSSLIANQSAKTVASELFASLLRTRSEAIARNANVTVAPLTGAWNSGWKILDPANATNMLESHGAATAVGIAGPAVVTYRPSGRVLAGVAPTFLITTTSGASTNYECISINLSGRPYMKAASTC
jgi:type IV fimbrial biogenesis protein FimT